MATVVLPQETFYISASACVVVSPRSLSTLQSPLAATLGAAPKKQKIDGEIQRSPSFYSKCSEMLMEMQINPPLSPNNRKCKRKCEEIDIVGASSIVHAPMWLRISRAECQAAPQIVETTPRKCPFFSLSFLEPGPRTQSLDPGNPKTSNSPGVPDPDHERRRSGFWKRKSGHNSDHIDLDTFSRTFPIL